MLVFMKKSSDLITTRKIRKSAILLLKSSSLFGAVNGKYAALEGQVDSNLGPRHDIAPGFKSHAHTMAELGTLRPTRKTDSPLADSALPAMIIGGDHTNPFSARELPAHDPTLGPATHFVTGATLSERPEISGSGAEHARSATQALINGKSVIVPPVGLAQSVWKRIKQAKVAVEAHMKKTPQAPQAPQVMIGHLGGSALIERGGGSAPSGTEILDDASTTGTVLNTTRNFVPVISFLMDSALKALRVVSRKNNTLQASVDTRNLTKNQLGMAQEYAETLTVPAVLKTLQPFLVPDGAAKNMISLHQATPRLGFFLGHSILHGAGLERLAPDQDKKVPLEINASKKRQQFKKELITIRQNFGSLFSNLSEDSNIVLRKIYEDEPDIENGKRYQYNIRSKAAKTLIKELEANGQKITDSEQKKAVEKLLRDVRKAQRKFAIATSQSINFDTPDSDAKGTTVVSTPFEDALHTDDGVHSAGFPNPRNVSKNWMNSAMRQIGRSGLSNDQLFKTVLKPFFLQWMKDPRAGTEEVNGSLRMKKSLTDAWASLTDKDKTEIQKAFRLSSGSASLYHHAKDSKGNFNNFWMNANSAWSHNPNNMISLILSGDQNFEMDEEKAKSIGVQGWNNFQKILKLISRQLKIPGRLQTIHPFTGDLASITAGTTSIAHNEMIHLPTDGQETVTEAGSQSRDHLSQAGNEGRPETMPLAESLISGRGNQPRTIDLSRTKSLLFKLFPRRQSVADDKTDTNGTMLGQVKFNQDCTTCAIGIFHEVGDGTDPVRIGHINVNVPEDFHDPSVIHKQNKANLQDADLMRNASDDERIFGRAKVDPATGDIVGIPSDEQFIRAIGYLRQTSTTWSPETLDVSRKMVDAWHKSNDDGSYCILMQRPENAALFNLPEDKEYKERVRARYFISAATRSSKIGQQDDISNDIGAHFGLDGKGNLSHIESMDVIEKLIAAGKTKQDIAVDQQRIINTQNLTNDESQKTIKYQGLYNFARSLVEDQMAQHAAFEHLNAAMALHKSDTPLMRDAATGEFINDPSRLDQQGPDYDPYGILVGLAGSAYSPQVIAKQALVSRMATVMPDNVTPEFALPLLASIHQPVQEVTPPPIQTPWTRNIAQWPLGFNVRSAGQNIDNMDVKQTQTVGDAETEKFANKPTLAEGWTFPLCLNEDDHGSLFFFGNDNPETNPVANKNDLLSLVNAKIASTNEILLARKTSSTNSMDVDDNAAAVFMKKTNDETTPVAKFNYDKTSIIVEGFTFLGKYDTPNGRSSFMTQSTGKIALPVVSKKDINGIVTYHLNMTPIRRQTQILTHAMQKDSTLQTENDTLLGQFNESEAEPLFQTILGRHFDSVPNLSLTRHKDGITNLDQITRHGGVTHNVTLKESIQAFQQGTGWTIDPDIRQYFDRDRRTRQGSGDMRIVAVRGSIAIIAIPSAKQSVDHPPDIDAHWYLQQHVNELLDAENRDYSKTQFGRVFGPHLHGTITWDFFKKQNADDPNKANEGGLTEFGYLAHDPLLPRPDAEFFDALGLGSNPQSDGKPGNYEKRQELSKQAGETVPVSMQFLVVDLRNANGIFEKPEDGKSLGVGTSVNITQGNVEDKENKTVVAGTETKQAQLDFSRWEKAKTINDAEKILAELFPDVIRSQFGFLSSDIGISRVRTIANGNQYTSRQREAAEILLNNTTQQENDFPADFDQRTDHINANFEEAQKTLDMIRRKGYEDAVYPINAENVLFKVSPQQLNSSYVECIDQIAQIADTINEGTIGKDLIGQQAQIEEWKNAAGGNPADSLGIVQLALSKTKNIHDEREANQDPVQSIMTDGISSNMRAQFYIREKVFVLPNFSSMNGRAEGLPKASMSAQDIRKSIGNFSTDLVETLEKLGIRIVIHSGDRESVESLDPSIKSNRKNLVNGKNTTWSTRDNTIFLGTRSENPMQDLLHHITSIYAEKRMNNPEEKAEAKRTVDSLISSTGNTELEKYARDHLQYDPNEPKQQDASIREYLKIAFQTQFSRNGKYHNFGGFLKQHELLGKVNHSLDDLQERVSAVDDTGVRAAPTLPVAPERQSSINLLLSDLNTKQRLAVESEGPTSVEGIPGAGKTKMLVSKMIHLIAARGVNAKKILAFTFTKASADNLGNKFDEAKRKAGTTLGSSIKSFIDDTTAIPHIGTMHSVAYSWIRKQNGKDPVLQIEGFNWNKGKYKQVKILEENQSKNMIKSIMDGLTESERQELDQDGNRWNAQSVSAKLAKIKDSEQSVHDEQSPLLRKVSSIYEEELTRRGLIDYSGLLQKVADHLTASKDARKTMQEKYSHIMADEFQDTNNVQMRILKAITPSDGGHLTVVGDKMQAIYGFRGGNSEFIDRDFFAKLYPKAKFINLDQNYRSRREILALAGAIEAAAGINRSMIPNATGVHGGAAAGTPLARDEIKNPTIFDAPVEIHKAAGKSSERQQMRYIDSVIRSLTGVSRGEIVDQTGVNAIAILCRTTREVEQVTKFLVKNGIKVKPKQKDPTLEEQISGYKPAGADTETAEKQPGIVVTTMHQSKGLEYPAVIIYNASVSSLPSAKSIKNSSENPEDREEALAEERRLFFTAATRAQRRLFITARTESTSPFVKEIEHDLQTRRGIINVTHEEK